MFKAAPGTALQAIALPPANYQSTWVSDVIVDGGFFWVQVSTNQQGPNRNLYYKLSTVVANPTSASWQPVDKEDYWDAWDIQVGNSSVVRDGSFAYDLSTLLPPGARSWVDENYGNVQRLPNDKLLVMVEVEPPSSSSSAIDIGYEHWFIFHNGSQTPVAQKGFSEGQGPSQWSVREPDEGFIYFQVVNVAFQRSGSEIIGITQATTPATTLFRIALSDVESVLIGAAASETLVSRPGVQQVMSFSQSQLAGGATVVSNEVALLDGYLEVGGYKAGDTGVLISSAVYHLPDDTSRFYLSRIEANGAVTKSTLIPADFEDVVIDPVRGVFVRAEDWDIGLSQAFHMDFTTGQVSEIPEEYFWKIHEADGVPQGVVFAAGTDGANALGSNSQTSAQWLLGGRGDDTLTGGRGNDLLAGGDGFDTAVYTGNRSHYLVEKRPDGMSYAIRDLRSASPDGTDTLHAVERVQFADQQVTLAYSNFYGVDLNGDDPGSFSEYGLSPFYYWRADHIPVGYSRAQPNPFYNAQVGLDAGIKTILVSVDKVVSDLVGVSLDWRFNWHETNQTTGELIYNAPVMRFGESASPVNFNRWFEGTQHSFTATSVARMAGGKTFYDLKIESVNPLPSEVAQDLVRSLGIEYRQGTTPSLHDYETKLGVKISYDGANFIGAQLGQAGITHLEFGNTPSALFQAFHSGSVIALAFNDGSLILGNDLANVESDGWNSWLGHPSTDLFGLEVSIGGLVDTSYSIQSAILEGNVFLGLNKATPDSATVRVRYTDPSGDQVKEVVQSWSGVDAASSDWVTSRNSPGSDGRALDGAVLGVRLNDDFPSGTYVADVDGAGLKRETPGFVKAVASSGGVVQSFTVEFQPTELFPNPSLVPGSAAGSFRSYAFTNEVITLELIPLPGQTVTVGQSITPEQVFSATAPYSVKWAMQSVIASNISTASPSAVQFNLAEYSVRDGQALPLSWLTFDIEFDPSSFTGSPFNDQLWGGLGNDTLDGGFGNNQLYGGPGNDVLTGGRRGRSGVDWNQADYRDATGSIAVTLGSANGTITTGSVVGNERIGTDTLINIDEVVGTAFNDTYIAHANWRGGQFRGYFPLQPGEITNPSTVLNSFAPGRGDDTITGNGYTRLAYYDASNAGITVNFNAQVAGTGTVNAVAAGLGVDTFTGVNSIVATSFDDVLIGGPGNEVFRPRGGNDFIDGGGGIDVIEFTQSREAVRVDLRITGPQFISVSEGTDTIINIERVAGSEFDDQLWGGDANNELYGRGGNDFLNGRTGTNWLEGGLGNDTLTGGTRGFGRIDFNMAGYSLATSHGIEAILGSANGQVSTGLVRALGSPSLDQVGVDTLLNIDSVRGTNQSDVFVAHDNWRGGQLSAFNLDAMFGSTHTPWIVPRGFNEFRGAGGNDTITGNGLTRISYRHDIGSSSITASFTKAGEGTVEGLATDGQAFRDVFSRVHNIRTTTGNDSINAAQGGNVVIAIEGGADTIIGSPSAVTMIDLRWSSNGVTVDLAKTTAQLVNQQDWSVTLANVRGVRGSEFADNLKGGAANEWFTGGAGNDTIDGGGGVNAGLYGGLRSEYTVAVNADTVSVRDNRTGQYNDGTDTLTNIQMLRFSDQDLFVGAPIDPPPPPPKDFSGKVYHWKNHALLSGVEVQAVPDTTGGGSGGAPSLNLFEIRNASQTGTSFKADIWVNLGSSQVENLLLFLGLSSNTSNASIKASAIPGWSLLDGQIIEEGVEIVTIGGISSSKATALTGSVKIGELTLSLPQGQSEISLGFLSGEAGSTNLSPYTLTYGAFKDITGPDGVYSIAGLTSGSVFIDAFKAISSGESSAVTAADALAALQIAVGRNPNGTAAVSPYQFFSADANGSGGITSADALATLKLAVRRSDAPAAEWLFVDERQDFWNETSKSFTTTRTNVPVEKDIAVLVDPAVRSEVNLGGHAQGRRQWQLGSSCRQSGIDCGIFHCPK